MREPRSSDGLGLRRAVFAVAAWSAFAGAWVFVAQRPGAVLLSPELLVIPVSAVVVALVSAFWVRHNRRIYQRKGPRRGVPVAAGPCREDRLGRAVDLDLVTLSGVQEVVLETTDQGKSYRAAS